MQYGSAGVGSGSHLACAQFNAAVGVDYTHIPYRGSPPAMQDLIAGRIDYFCALAAAAPPQLDSKTMKPLAILTRARSPLVPALADRGRAGRHRLRFEFLERPVRAQGHPARRREAARRRGRYPRHTSVQERLKNVGVTVVAADRRSPDYLKRFVAWRSRPGRSSSSAAA